MVYLVGVDHEIQIKCECILDPKLAKDQAAYGLELNSLLLNRKISFIAEEISEDGKHCLQNKLHGHSPFDTIAEVLARKGGIQHRSVDPSKKIRAALGIPNRPVPSTHAEAEKINIDWRKYDAMKESYWLSQLPKNLNEMNALFVCGANHLKTFGALLQKNNIGYEVIGIFWGNIHQ